MAFENILGGGGSPQGAPAGPAMGAGGGQAQGGMPPSAKAVIDQFIDYAKSKGKTEEEIVQLLIESMLAAKMPAPPEEKVRELVHARYANTPEAAAAQGAPTAPAEGSPMGGSLPLQ